MSLIQRIRERVNLFIYDSKKSVLRVLRIVNIFVSITAVMTLLYSYGYPQDEVSKEIGLNIIKSSFAFYIFYYLIRLLYDFEPLEFIRRHWFEGIIMAFLFIEGVFYNITGVLVLERLFQAMGISYFSEISTVFIQLYFLFIVISEVMRRNLMVPLVRLHPATLFTMSFLILIFGGTILLMMPEMTTMSGSMSFIDALFTSTSATCVTGLSVVDTATFFTFKGQLVILVLIKLGGLNIVAFVSFIVLMSKFGIGVKYHSFLDDYAKRGTIDSAMQMLRKILLWSLFFELSGATMIYMMMEESSPLFASNGDRVFASIFHSISAFNNAGFSIFTDGLYNEYVRYNYFLHAIVMGLIFLGSLGFAAMFDLFSPENLRERMRRPWKKLQFMTRISLYFSIALVLFGAFLFLILEWNNTLYFKDSGEAVITSLFQSITTRTAGFNTVDIASLSVPTVIIFLFLMFIGASSNSTGGGIKTSTFAILMAATWSTMRDKKNVELFKRTISKELLLKAFTILLFFISWNLVAIFLLTITESEILLTEGRSVMDVIFEQVSAFGTVGLSTGVTAALSPEGRLIILLSMFIGKVGLLSVAYIFGRKPISTDYKYPYAEAMVG